MVLMLIFVRLKLLMLMLMFVSPQASDLPNFSPDFPEVTERMPTLQQ